MYDVITVGSATEDVFVVLKDSRVIRIEDVNGETAYFAVPYGAKIPVDGMEVMTGGGSTNVSAALARMGLKVACVCKVGDDGPGQRIVGELQDFGVDTSLVLTTTEFRTGYSVILTAFTGERTILVHRGANRHISLEELPLQTLRTAQWLYLGSMRGPAARLFFDLAEFAQQHNIKLAVNPGSTQLALGLDGLTPVLRHTELFLVNKEEAYALTGVAPDRSKADEHEMLRMLHEAGCKQVVITAGQEGADGYDGEAFYFVPAFRPRKVVSTVGAGDSFAAGCLAGLHRGLTLPEAMRIGAANAASVVCKVGAKHGLLTWDEAAAFLDQHA